MRASSPLAAAKGVEVREAHVGLAAGAARAEEEGVPGRGAVPLSLGAHHLTRCRSCTAVDVLSYDADGIVTVGSALKEKRKPERVGWTRQEDAIITQSVQELGHRWYQIAMRLPGRTDHAIRNRWHRLQSMWNDASQSPATPAGSPT